MSESRTNGTSFLGHLRNYLLTGLLILAPSAVTLWVFYRLLNYVDNILGRYLRFPALDYHRIPGIGLVATLLLLLLVGWMASWIGARPALRAGLVPPWLVRIDYVFYSEELEAIDAQVCADSGGSDHRGVIATLVLR